MFQEFGAIESATVRRGDQGELLNSGYVCFKDPVAATNAIAAMNRKELGGGKVLLVSQFISKKDNELVQGPKSLNPIS
jgi:RNA recognition motif-containing protein